MHRGARLVGATNSNNWFGQGKAATRSERQIGLTRLVMKVRVRHIAGDMLVWSVSAR